MTGLKLHFKNFLLKAFEVREGEYRRVLLMVLYIFLMILTLMIIKPVASAQFLAVIGASHLPLMYILVAVVAMGVTTLYSRLLARRSLRMVIVATLVISIVSFVAMAICLHMNVAEKLVLYLLYIGVSIYGVLVTSQFWIMANLTFDSREAKRLFGLIGAGAIAGGITGGYLTSVLSSFMGGPGLLLTAGGLMCLCFPLNHFIWRDHIKGLTAIQNKKKFKEAGTHPFWLIKNSPYLTYLALAIGLSVVVAKLIDFQFSSLAAAAIPDREELTAFFGFWLSSFNVVSLLIQLFITSRIVGKFGVGRSLFALPGGLIISSVLLIFAPVLFAGIIAKMWDVSVKQSLNKAATELLALPISRAIKSQTKTFIDVVVDMVATGLSGLLLIFFINGMNLPILAVSALTLVILGIWMWVAVKLRREYIRSFRSKLKSGNLQRKKHDFKDAKSVDKLRQLLDSGSEKQVLHVLRLVEQVADPQLYADVMRFLTHKNPDIRLHTLKCLLHLSATADTEILESLLHDEVHDVRYLAFEMLLRQTPGSRMEIINAYLEAPDKELSGIALASLSKIARDNQEVKRVLKVQQRIREKMELLEKLEDERLRDVYKIMILRAIGNACIDSLYGEIDRYLRDKSIKVVREAVIAAGLTEDLRFIPGLESSLVNKQTRQVAIEALTQYSDYIVPVLRAHVVKSKINYEIARQIPLVLERINDQTSVEALLKFLDIDDNILRLAALRSLHNLLKRYPNLKSNPPKIVNYIIDEVNLYKESLIILYNQRRNTPKSDVTAVLKARAALITLIERRLDGAMERIFHLLGLQYPPEDVMPALNGLRNDSREVRINAVEYLDTLLEPSLRKTLVPIAELASFESLSGATFEALKVEIPDERACLQMLLVGREPRLKIAVIDLIRVLDKAEYVDLITPLVESPIPIVKEEAQQLIEALVTKH